MGHGGGNFLENMELGKLLLIFLGVLFFLWLLTGGQENSSSDRPFIKPYTDTDNPGQLYGPTDLIGH